MLKLLSAHDEKLSAILNNIRATRKNRGYTQAYMAQALKISQYSYNRKETGSSGFTLTEFFKISEILKVEPVELIEYA